MKGFIDHSGAFVIEPEYRDVHPFSEGYATVQTLDKRWGYIDTKGNWVAEPKYYYAYGKTALDIPEFCDDLLLVSERIRSESRSGWRYAWIDRSGKETLMLIMPGR